MKASFSIRGSENKGDMHGFAGQQLVLQSKAVCPCDGGCPRCAPVIQPKLLIGKPDDEYEREADRIADEVMRMPEPSVQAKPT